MFPLFVYFLQGYGITSYPTYNYYKQNSIIFSHESSNALLIHKNQGKASSEKKIRFHDRKLSDNDDILSTFRSIQISSQSYNFLTSMPKNFKERKSISNNQQRYRKERNIENKQGIVNRNGNSHRCDVRNRKRDLMISSSAELSFAENYYPKYFEYYTRKRKRKTRDKKRVCERIYNRQKCQTQYTCTCNRRLYKGTSSEISSPYVYGGKSENVHEQFYRVFRMKNIGKFPFLKNSQQTFDKIINMPNYYDNNYLHQKSTSMVLTQNYNDYINDIDLNFKLKLLQYVELCKSVKRALMRTF